MRFNRDYELTIGLDSQAVVIKPPFRISFGIDKSITGGLNKAKIQIYNMKESTRLQLVRDVTDQKYIPVVLKIGYQDSIGTIFKGSVMSGSNNRQGADFISELDCLDGGYDYINSFVSAVARGKETAINQILKAMPNTQKGKITKQEPIQRPKVLVGSPSKMFDDLLAENETYYIDNEQLFIIKPDSEVTSSFIPVVTAQSGLINTPQKQSEKVTFDTMMNPSLKIGELCQLESSTAPNLNGLYKIQSMNYTGDYDGNDWRQAVTCYAAKGYKVI